MLCSVDQLTACEDREPIAAPTLPEMMQRDKIKQTKRRSCDAHMQIVILHGSFENPAVLQRVKSAHSGSRRSQRTPARFL